MLTNECLSIDYTCCRCNKGFNGVAHTLSSGTSAAIIYEYNQIPDVKAKFCFECYMAYLADVCRIAESIRNKPTKSIWKRIKIQLGIDNE